MTCTGCNAKRATLYGYELTEQFLGHVRDAWYDLYDDVLPEISLLRLGSDDYRYDSLTLTLDDISVVTADGSCIEESGSCAEQTACSATMEVRFKAYYVVITDSPLDKPTDEWNLPEVTFPTLPGPFTNEEYVSSTPTVTASVSQPNIKWQPFVEDPNFWSVEYTITLRQVFTIACDSDLIVTFSFEDLGDNPGNILPTATGGMGGPSFEMPVEPSDTSGHNFWHSVGELEIAMGCDKCYRSVRVPGGDDQKPGSQGGGKNYNQSSI